VWISVSETGRLSMARSRSRLERVSLQKHQLYDRAKGPIRESSRPSLGDGPMPF
jgi:hypothetical protein